MQSIEQEIKIKDAAQALALSDMTLYRAVAAGMPHARYGRIIRVRLSEVRAWLSRGQSVDSVMTGGAR